MIEANKHPYLLQAENNYRQTQLLRDGTLPRHARALGIEPAPDARHARRSRRHPRVALAGILGIVASVAAGLWTMAM